MFQKLNSCPDVLVGLGSEILTESSLGELHSGVVTRICNFKYGFLQSDNHENIFFHFSELSDDAKATVEPGSRVTFHVKRNQWTDDKKLKAIQIRVISSPDENEFKNIQGIVQGDMTSRGFCFIENIEDKTTCLFHSINLVNDEASKEAGNTVKAGHKVIFDAEWNHKYNPPKQFAVNVRLIPGQDALNAAASRLETRPSWGGFRRRGSQSDLTNEVSERLSIYSSRQSNVSDRASVGDRASALKANGPVRRWSRTTATDAPKSDKPAGGVCLTQTTCKFGRKCTHADCWFDHPKGRKIDDGVSDDEGEAPAEDVKVASMGKSSLRLLVTALVKDQGKIGYLAIRNALQKPHYLGRELTLNEKSVVGEILEGLDTFSKPQAEADLHPADWRSASMSRLPSMRSSFSGRNSRTSLSDLCRDPSLHARLSAANTSRHGALA